MKRGLVSVIVPVFNTRDYILRCLKSIAFQDYSYIEVIVVDDGSTDGSGELCDSFCESDSRFRCIHQDNQGQWAARNAGLLSADGEYICFVDSDDFLDPRAIKSLHSILVEGYEVAMIGYMEIQGESRPVRDNRPFSFESVSRDQLFSTILKGCGMDLILAASVTNKCFRRESLIGIFFRDMYAMEDLDFNVRVLKGVSRIGFDHRNLYYYLIREGSTMHDNSLVDKRLYSTLCGMIDVYHSFSNDEMLYRGWCLSSIYRRYISRRFLLRKSDYYEPLKMTFRRFHKETKSEFYKSGSVTIIDKVAFALIWFMPFIGSVMMKVKTGS